MQKPTAAPKARYKSLTPAQKLQFVGKLMIFLVSFGFAFPLLLSE